MDKIVIIMTILIIPIILGLVEGIVSLILVILTIKMYFNTKIFSTIILSVLTGTIAVNGFLFSFILFIGKDNEIIAYWNYVIMVVFAIITILLINIFFDYIEFGYIKTSYIFFCGGLTGAIIAILFIPNQIEVFYSETFGFWLINLNSYTRVFIAILGLITIIRIIKGFIVVNRATLSKRVKFQFKIFFIGIVFALVGLFTASLYGILVSNFDFYIGTIVRGFYPLFIATGLSITFISFYMNPYSVYSISQKVFQIIVFNQNGLTIFESRRFYEDDKSKRATLITGAIYGVSSMLQSALGIDSRPESLKYGDRTLLFTYREKIGFTLISDRYSKILYNGLENFADFFIQEFSEQLENWKGSTKLFLNANKLIKKSFPFLDTA